MIYVDTSVIVAYLLAEDAKPPAEFWTQHLVSSRLLQYETWTRINSQSPDPTLTDATNEVLQRISFLEMTPVVLRRALDAWPVRLRTLDALHLASFEYLREAGQSLSLASYDGRMRAVARKLHIPFFELGRI